MRGPNARRQFSGNRGIIHGFVHVGEIGALRLHALDPFERLRQVRMGGVRFLAHAIDDPGLNALERFKGGIIKRVNIC